MRAAGSGAEFEVEVEHRMEYDPGRCGRRERNPDTRTTRLKSARNYLKYEEGAQVRYKRRCSTSPT